MRRRFVFYRGLRGWLARRRIERLLREEGWPMSTHIFNGNVVLSEVVYSDGSVREVRDP